jgi:hypothetical protein
LPILLLHALRHLGLMFLAPGAVYPGIPAQFTIPAAFGDLLAAVLAVDRDSGGRDARAQRQALVWLFNIEGSLDLAAAIAARHRSTTRRQFMGTVAYWIPAFLGAGTAGHPLRHVPRPAHAPGRQDARSPPSRLVESNRAGNRPWSSAPRTREISVRSELYMEGGCLCGDVRYPGRGGAAARHDLPLHVLPAVHRIRIPGRADLSERGISSLPE